MNKPVKTIFAAIATVLPWGGLAWGLLFTSCMDMDDTTPPVSTAIQLVRPADFVNMTDLSGYTITLQSGIDRITAVTDAEGRVSLSELAPNTYDITVSCDITKSQYEQFTGQTVGGNMDFMLTATLNQQVIDRQGTILLPLSAYPKQSLIIGKVYPSWKRTTGSTFQYGKYIELYNNSDAVVDASGLYVGLLDSESSLPFIVYPYDKAGTPGFLHMKQVFRIPATTPVEVQPGGTLLLVNSAFDHSIQNEWESDLTGADFEAKDLSTVNPVPNNSNVPALELVYTAYNTGNSPLTNLNLVQGGPTSIVLFKTSEDVASWPLDYATGKTTGRQFLRVPVECVLDGVDILKHSTAFEAGANINLKRLFAEVDASFTYVNAVSGNAGERLVRKTASIAADGRKILKDTNNSRNDFECNDQIQPRVYLEP